MSGPRVAHVYSDLSRMHGASKWLLLFATKLQQAGLPSHIVCPRSNIALPAWFDAELTPLVPGQQLDHSVSGARKLLYIIGQALLMPLLTFRIPADTDVIVYHGDLSVLTSLTARLRFRRCRHLYYCYQSPRELYDLKAVTRRTYGHWLTLLAPLLSLYKWLDRRLVRAMEAVIVWSKEHQGMIEPIYGRLNYQPIGASVDFDTLSLTPGLEQRLEALRREHLPTGEHLLLMNASLTNKKRIPLFIDLVAALRDEGYRVRGAVIGEGPEEDALRQRASERGVGDAFIFAGYVTQEDLPAWYHLADMLLFLEPRALWTMSIIEAGAAGIPAVCARGGSMPTLVDDGVSGFLVEEDDLAELAAPVKRLLDDPELRRRMGEASRAHCRAWSTEAAVDRFRSLLAV